MTLARLTRCSVAAASALLLGTLAACGSDASPSSSAASAAASTPAASAAAPSGAADAAGFPRTISHHQGSTEIPAQPQRVVALDNSLVEAALAIGGKVVGGICAYRDQKTCPPYLGEAGKQIQDVGPLESPNLEAVAALEPDLIVSASVRHEALYDELAKIAPTVFVETTGPMWKDNIALLGQTLGLETAAADAVSAYEERAAALGKAINAKAGNPTVSVVRFLDGPTRLYANASFSGIILQDMGLARPEVQDVEEFAVEIGEEQIRKADADHIFVTTYSGGEGNAERFQRNPLWKRLGAVAAGNVHEVKDEIWMTSVSLQGAELIMDDMAKAFGVDPQKG